MRTVHSKADGWSSWDRLLRPCRGMLDRNQGAEKRGKRGEQEVTVGCQYLLVQRKKVHFIAGLRLDHRVCKKIQYIITAPGLDHRVCPLPDLPSAPPSDRSSVWSRQQEGRERILPCFHVCIKLFSRFYQCYSINSVAHCMHPDIQNTLVWI